MRYTVIPFRQSKFNFGKHLELLFWGNKWPGTRHLKDLHHLLIEQHVELFEVGKDSSTIFHERFYERYKGGWPDFELMYEWFVSEVVAPLFDEDFLYQKFPTFRVHLPGNVAVGDFHTDAEFHHPAGELNFIIPLTDSKDTACPWVESEPGKNDFEPIPLQIGRLIQFDGNVLRHGNRSNKTGKTRVSMDFRVLPISKYNPEAGGESITRKTKFVEGEYYKRFTK
jgi:hypothetical protein